MSATNRGATRLPDDSYNTPPETIRALLLHIKPFGRFLEPCLGSMNITRAVGDQYRVREVDFCEITQGRDFLTYKPTGRYDWIITNPPYSLAREFIEKSLDIADHVAMLLRLNFLESEKRRLWWQNRLPTALYVLAQRPGFLDMDGKRVKGKNGKPGKPGTDACAYGWFVWSELYKGIHVIGNGS